VTEVEVHTNGDGDVTVAHPVGDLDAFNASEFRSRMEPIASSPRLVIDLGGVSFVDSAGLGALIGAVRRVQELGGEVMLASARPALARLLQHTGVLRIVPCAATVDEGIEALSRQAPPS
jgi:anti-sigma B factor antagonist